MKKTALHQYRFYETRPYSREHTSDSPESTTLPHGVLYLSIHSSRVTVIVADTSIRVKRREIFVSIAYHQPLGDPPPSGASLPSSFPTFLFGLYGLSTTFVFWWITCTTLLVCDLASSWSVWVNKEILKQPDRHCLSNAPPISGKDSVPYPPVDRASRTPCTGKPHQIRFHSHLPVHLLPRPELRHSPLSLQTQKQTSSLGLLYKA